MKILINEILKKSGKTVYWLAKQTKISQNSMGKIVKGDTDSIRFDNLEKICIALDCTPNDILKIECMGKKEAEDK